MKHTQIAPYKVLICIVDTKVTQQILDYLNDKKETIHYTSLAEGTRRLGILQMLGVGRIERNVIIGIIRTSTASQTLLDLDKILMLDNEKSYGWAFTTRLSSITSEVIEFINGERQASDMLEKQEIEKTKLVENQSSNDTTPQLDNTQEVE